MGLSREFASFTDSVGTPVQDKIITQRSEK